MSRTLTFLAIPLFVVSALLACGGGSQSHTIAPNVTLRGNVTVEMGDYTVRFDHSVGSTSCPQPLDEWEVFNDRDAPITVIVSSGDSAISVEPTTATIAPGASARFRVAFTCSRPTAVDEVVGIEVQDSEGATLSNNTVRVMGNVR